MMEPVLEQRRTITDPSAPEITTEMVCSVCHQAVLLEYYFCPNCGNALHTAPLSTKVSDQIKLYVFSVVLPMIGFLLVTRWKGAKYFKSEDPKTKQIGTIAWSLLVFSTIVTVWYAVVWTQNYIQSTVNGINADMSGL